MPDPLTREPAVPVTRTYPVRRCGFRLNIRHEHAVTRIQSVCQKWADRWGKRHQYAVGRIRWDIEYQPELRKKYLFCHFDAAETSDSQERLQVQSAIRQAGEIDRTSFHYA